MRVKLLTAVLAASLLTAACGGATETADVAAPATTAAITATSDHCGQPAVGEAFTGAGNEALTVAFGETGDYLAEITARGPGHIAVNLRNHTGEIDSFVDNELLANEAVLHDEEGYDGGRVPFGVAVGGDFYLDITADPDMEWSIQFIKR